MPVLLVSAGINVGFSWWVARRVATPVARPDWGMAFERGRAFVGLGLAIALSALLMAALSWITRLWILRRFGMEANGFYQAAWAISGVFAGFILQAMGMDFYPRLTVAAQDDALVNRLVNEQTEVGVPLALPGLLATIVFTAWIISLLYSRAFHETAELLPWFVIGMFGRVVSWPLGFIQLAKGAAKCFTATEVCAAGLHLALVFVMIRWLHLRGVAIAFAALYVCYTAAMFWAAGRLGWFSWSRETKNLLVEAGLYILVVFLLIEWLPPFAGTILGGVLVEAGSWHCLRVLCRRLGPQHRLCQTVTQVPWLGSKLLA